MGALRDFLAEVRRQAELLERANAADDAAECAYFAGEMRRSNGRKSWTRQDANRIRHESGFDDAYEARDSEKLDSLINVGCGLRMNTRVGWFVHRFSHGDSEISSLRPAALEDARLQGIYATVAPMLVAIEAAHKRLLDAYEHENNVEYFKAVGWDWRDAMEGHALVIAELESYLPERPLSDEERRQQFCFEQKKSGKTYKEINAALKRHASWESYENDVGVRSAIEAWARKTGEQLPRQNRGRPGKQGV